MGLLRQPHECLVPCDKKHFLTIFLVLLYKMPIEKKKKVLYYTKKTKEGIFVQIYKVVGISNYSFTNSSGEVVAGYTYHLLSTVEEKTDNFTGFQVATEPALMYKVNAWRESGSLVPKVGDLVLPLYSRKGKLESFVNPDVLGKPAR